MTEMMDPALSMDDIITDHDADHIYEQRRKEANTMMKANQDMKKKMETTPWYATVFGSPLGISAIAAFAAGGIVVIANPPWGQKRKDPYCAGRTSLIVVLVVMVLVFLMTFFGP